MSIAHLDPPRLTLREHGMLLNAQKLAYGLLDPDNPKRPYRKRSWMADAHKRLQFTLWQDVEQIANEQRDIPLLMLTGRKQGQHKNNTKLYYDASGWDGVDLDSPTSRDELIRVGCSWEDILASGYPINDTTRGLHILTPATGLRCWNGALPKIDFKADGGYLAMRVGVYECLPDPLTLPPARVGPLAPFIRHVEEHQKRSGAPPPRKLSPDRIGDVTPASAQRKSQYVRYGLDELPLPGGRNDWYLRKTLSILTRIPQHEATLEYAQSEAREINASLQVPLPVWEVDKVARNAWKQRHSRNFVAHDPTNPKYREQQAARSVKGNLARWGDNNDKALAARALREQGMSYRKIADELGASHMSIKRWCSE